MNLYGAGGHCKVIIDIINSLEKRVDTVFDDNINISSLLNIPVTQWKIEYQTQHKNVLISIGNNKIRKKISETIAANFISLIHPSAIVSKYATIGKGTVVMASAVINAGATIGKHCIVNTAAVIEHDCILEDFVHISPNTTITGSVTIGEGTHIGAGAIVLPNIKIGNWATVGAAAVVLKKVPDFATVVGNPARILNYKNKKNE